MDDRLLREFAWALDEAYEELAELLVTDSPAAAGGEDEDAHD